MRLAELLRKQKDLNPDQIKTKQREADKILDKLVENNALSPKAYLARWRYRRQFGLLNLRGEPGAGQVALKDAANDVAQALQRAPESVDVLLAAADLERLEGQAAFTAAKPEDRDKRLSEHRDKALAYLNQGLKLHARGGRSAAADLTQFSCYGTRPISCWTTSSDWTLCGSGAEPAQSAERGSVGAAEVAQAIEQIRKTRGSPTAADYLKARLLLQDRRWAEAVTLFEQVRPTLGTQPDLAEQINLYLGQCYEQLDEPGQMYKALRTAGAESSRTRCPPCSAWPRRNGRWAISTRRPSDTVSWRYPGRCRTGMAGLRPAGDSATSAAGQARLGDRRETAGDRRRRPIRTSIDVPLTEAQMAMRSESAPWIRPATC